MTSIPSVAPGDMVLWHTDLVHAVESRHQGQGDSSVMYIPAVPLTRKNLAYVQAQRDAFAEGIPPADFPGGSGEKGFSGRAHPDDVTGQMARRAMGLEPLCATSAGSKLEELLIREANLSLSAGH